MIKRLFDIIYEIHDEAKNKSNIVNFDRLVKATFSNVKLDQSDNKSDQQSENESVAAIKIVIFHRQHVPKIHAAYNVTPQFQPVAAAASKFKPK